MISNGKSRCQGLAFFAAAAAGNAVDWLARIHFVGSCPKLFLIISSIPVARFPVHSRPAAGRAACRP